MTPASRSTDRSDSEFMRRAIELAERGRGRVAPNPLVGAVIVQNGEIIGEGWHQEFGGAHAEINALREAGERARGATAYVTLEPCDHHGKTPPCSQALRLAGINRVVYAVDDPNPDATGGGEMLTRNRVEVTRGIEQQAAEDLNARFLHAYGPNSDRPWVELKLALSLDGKIADSKGRSAWLTGETAREEVHRLRAGHAAIAVGVGTVLADDPLLTTRGAIRPRITPVRIIFDRSLKTPTEARIIQTIDEAPVWIVCSPSSPTDRREVLEKAGARIIEADALRDALRMIRSKGIDSVFCEGGADIAAQLIDDELVDRLTFFYAPLIIGPGGRDPFAELPDRPLAELHRWRTVRSERFNNDTLVVLSP